jgi:hypothetical protein
MTSPIKRNRSDSGNNSKQQALNAPTGHQSNITTQACGYLTLRLAKAAH